MTFYIDLGTANTLVYAKGHGFKINEPTILTMKQKDEQYIEHSALARKQK
ncbi:MAG: rod shape-determining protein [Bdellovibrionales bacterium]